MRMANIAQLLTEYMDIWTAADTVKKSGRGRARGNAGSVYGVKKLRELILDLAMRGKLVPQDSSDEPASELLKRIKEEKGKLIAEGKLKKEKPPSPISENEQPFELPEGWQWSRLGLIGLIGSSSRIHQKDWTNSGVPFYRAREIVKLAENGFVDNELFITEELFEILKQNSVVPESNDVMITGVGTIGVPYIVQTQDRFYFKDASVLIFKNFSKIYTSYLKYFLLSNIWNEIIHSESMGTTVHTLTIERAKEVSVPIPPLAEQHRIVAKVDELMALCDQLEQQHSNAQAAHEALVRQLLGTLTQSQNPAEFNANWQRIDAHFDVLFNTEASIDGLKQTLLQLAVMGKLVPQDPNDEPASELLKRIQAEKNKLIAAGKLKKEKPLISMNEKPFELPQGWEWTNLLNAAVINPRNNASDDIKASFVPMTLIGSAFTDKHQDEKRLWKEIKQGFTHFAEGDIGVAKITPCFENSKACVFENLENGLGAGTTELHIVRPVMNTLSPRYVLAYLKSPRFLKLGESKMTGTAGQKRLPKDFVETNPFPLPPLAEQHRIVAKVDVLMALCDQLKIRIQQANQQQQTIANALVAQAIQPSAEIIDLADYRAAVASHAVNKMQNKPYFGRTTLMKSLSLAQSHIGLKLNFQLERKQAGPFDPWIYDFERQAEQEGWLKLTNTKLINGFTKVDYLVKATNPQKSDLIEKIFTVEQLKEFDRLLVLLADKTTEEVEIIATLFAAWNDFLIDGNTPSDDEIVKEVRENWHESKARFTPNQLKENLNWMRRNHLVPQGRPPRTVYQQQLLN